MSPESAPLLTPQREISTVTELVRRIRYALEGNFTGLWVVGEISGLTRAGSGHWYFNLKDAGAQIRSVMFKGSNRFVRFDVREGLEVMAYGAVSMYERRGECQFIVEEMSPKGMGALQLAYEQLKARLEAEGLFNPAHKRPLPFLPRKVGLVTSAKGAAVHDLISVMTRRYPNIEILLYPVLVQGDEAPPQIVQGIKRLGEEKSVDVVIAGRGGGSLEDLWAFNDERVARAIFTCPKPVISAVGHEVDFTIADFVADLRAATPSAAAELVVPEKAALEEGIYSLKVRMGTALGNRMHRLKVLAGVETRQRLERAVRMFLSRYEQHVDLLQRDAIRAVQQRTRDTRNRCRTLEERLLTGTPRQAVLQRRMSLVRLSESLVSHMRYQVLGRRRSATERLGAHLSPRQLLALHERQSERLQRAERTLSKGLTAQLERRKVRWEGLRDRLQGLSPLAVLDRGYAIVTAKKGKKVVMDAAEVLPGEGLHIRVAKGTIGARVQGTSAQKQVELELE